MLTPQQIQNLTVGQKIKYTDLLPYLVGETCSTVNHDGQLICCPITANTGTELHLKKIDFKLYEVLETKILYRHD